MDRSINVSTYQIHPSSKRRRWWFPLLTVSLVLSPLLLLELTLRYSKPVLRDYVDPDPLVNIAGQRPLFVRGEDPSRLVVAPDHLSFFRPDSFLAEKPPLGKRIFVLGGSTVQGNPFAHETAFSTWLRLRLQANAPETPIEVVNCGGISYASYRVAKILDEVLQYEPDAIIIYTGQNEFLESRTYEQVRSMGPFRRSVAGFASHVRIVTWIREMLLSPSAPRTRLADEVDARLDAPGGLDLYHRDPKWIENVETHFEITLRRMVQACQSAGVECIVCVPAVDLVNTPPFKSELDPAISPDDKAAFQTWWTLATRTDEAHSASDKLNASRECLKIDPQHAGANYLKGRLLLDLGDSHQAAIYLQRACDRDVCPLRATTPIVNATREIVQEFDLPFIDTPRLLDRKNAAGLAISDGIADPESFVDHVHPTIVMHQLIAAEIADRFTKLGWPRPMDDGKERYLIAQEKQLAGLTDAYYVRGKQRLEGLRQWAAGRALRAGTPLFETTNLHTNETRAGE
jgi:lysophospholipase L1-like esterase